MQTKMMNLIEFRVSKMTTYCSIWVWFNDNYTLLTAFSSNWKIVFFIFQGSLLGLGWNFLETNGGFAWPKIFRYKRSISTSTMTAQGLFNTPKRLHGPKDPLLCWRKVTLYVISARITSPALFVRNKSLSKECWKLSKGWCQVRSRKPFSIQNAN